MCMMVEPDRLRPKHMQAERDCCRLACMAEEPVGHRRSDLDLVLDRT